MVSQFWVTHGGASNTLNHFEFPIVVLICFLLYFNPEREKENAFSIHTFTPVATLIGLYIIYDIVFSYFDRSPRLSDFSNIHLLLEVSIYLQSVFLLSFAAAFAPVVYSWYCWVKNVSTMRGCTVIGVRVFLISLVLVGISSQKMYVYQQQNLSFVDWSDTRNVIKNGRIGSFIYYHSKRLHVLSQLEQPSDISINSLFYSKKPLKIKNIHVVVLESFIDPRKIKRLTFSRSPVGENLKPYLQNGKDFQIIKTTVYGGGSPQSEFEILTGIPALARLGGIEFNLFEGTKSSSLVNALREIGYYAIVSKGSTSGFYNSTAAYNGIGFDELHYLDKHPYYQKSAGDDYIFDGDLLDANLKYIKDYLEKSTSPRPLLNYVVGMYGHLPFERNKKLRPDIVSVSPANRLLEDLTNQFYHRTNALGSYLTRLQEMDPEAIVLICSDHLPPIITSEVQYALDSKTANIGLLLDSFNPVNMSGRRYYEIPHLIWNLLGDSVHSNDLQAIFKKYDKEKIYLAYLSEAMGVDSSQ
jgi:phosphoglycerol transferase MdoB-like AlkP superfamily enzyme